MVTIGAIGHAKLRSNNHHQQTNIQFFTGRMFFLSPNQQRQSTEGKTDLCFALQNILRQGVWAYVIHVALLSRV